MNMLLDFLTRLKEINVMSVSCLKVSASWRMKLMKLHSRYYDLFYLLKCPNYFSQIPYFQQIKNLVKPRGGQQAHSNRRTFIFAVEQEGKFSLLHNYVRLRTRFSRMSSCSLAVDMIFDDQICGPQCPSLSKKIKNVQVCTKQSTRCKRSRMVISIQRHAQ